MFSSRSFRILGIIFRSIIHFELIFKMYFIHLFIFSRVGSPLLRGLFSSFSEQGLLPSRCTWASHCGGFPCCRAQALGHTGFSTCDTWAQLLLQHVESSPTRNQTHVPCVGSQILYHDHQGSPHILLILPPTPQQVNSVRNITVVFIPFRFLCASSGNGNTDS